MRGGVGGHGAAGSEDRYFAMLNVEFDSAFLSHEVLRLAATWPGSFLKEPLGLVSLAARASSIQISPLGEVARDSFSEED